LLILRLIERHQEPVERERQAARERARQIRWLESEFAAIQPEKRMEAASARALYEQVWAEDDPEKKLETVPTENPIRRMTKQS